MWQICGEKETCGTKGDFVSGWKQSMKSVSNNKWQEVSRGRSHSTMAVVTDKEAVSGKEKAAVRYLNCADAAIEKTEQLVADVKQCQTNKAEREMGSVDSMEVVNPVELVVVAEPEFQYGQRHLKYTSRK